MSAKLIHTFAIKGINKNSKSNSFIKVSRRCLATIIFTDNQFKAQVSLEDGDVPNYLCIPLTPKSMSLKGKTHVWSNELDLHGRKILIIRDVADANLHPGNYRQYCPVRENLVISGYIVKQNEKMYFEFEEIVAYSPNGARINIVKIDTSKPLFENGNKRNK